MSALCSNAAFAQSVKYATERNNFKPVLMGVSSGTGFYVNRNGYLITNAHVVKNCQGINVQGGVDSTEAKLVAIDRKLDLALLKTKKRPKRIAPMRYNKSLEIGDKVVVIGYPEKHGMTRKYKIVTSSIIDTKGPRGEDDWIQFSDASAKGNSGGPLLDDSGNVIGVVTAKLQRMRWDGKPMGSSDLAINMPILKKFLNKNFVHFDQLFHFQPISQRSIERKAREFILSVHCYQP